MNTLKSRLQVLLVEDSENDAAMLEVELERAGYEPVCRRVETAAAVAAALEQQSWDLIIADYALPRFNGLAALELVNQRGLDLPFIIVSGVITDEKAVAAMKAGAHDYVMKDNLHRLGPAVQRELRDAEVRRARRRADQKLKAESAFRQAIESSIPSGIAVVDLEGRQTYVNPAFCELVGWADTELVGAKPPFAYWPPEQVEAIGDALGRVTQGLVPAGGIELPFCRRDGERIDVLLLATPLRDDFGNFTGWVSSVSNITQRKRAERRLAAEHAVTRLLAGAASLEDAGPQLLRTLLDGVEADCGSLWLPDSRRSVLTASATSSRESCPALAPFLEAGRRMEFSDGAGLPGRVWHERKVLWVADLQATSDCLRREAAVNAGLHSALAFPVESGGVFFGIFEFFSLRRMQPDTSLVNMLTAIGAEIGQFVHRRNAEEALRRAHDELELRVEQRTAELNAAYAKLQAAVAERTRLEHELLEITEQERRRIGLDLHDDLGQHLAGIVLMTRGLELTLARKEAPEAQDAARIHALVQQAMTHTRDVVRDLAALDLKQHDLSFALDHLAAHATQVFEISCRFKGQGKIPALEPSVASQLYKITQEAVTNAIRHGKAKRVDISLANGSDKLLLTIQNNGRPFPDLTGREAGMGLRIMNYRASLIGASLEIKAAGTRGTLLTCSMPIGKH